MDPDYREHILAEVRQALTRDQLREILVTNTPKRVPTVDDQIREIIIFPHSQRSNGVDSYEMLVCPHNGPSHCIFASRAEVENY